MTGADGLILSRPLPSGKGSSLSLAARPAEHPEQTERLVRLLDTNMI